MKKMPLAIVVALVAGLVGMLVLILAVLLGAGTGGADSGPPRSWLPETLFGHPLTDRAMMNGNHGAPLVGSTDFDHEQVATFMKLPADQAWSMTLTTNGTYEWRVVLSKGGLRGVESGTYRRTPGALTLTPTKLEVPSTVKGASDLVKREYAELPRDRYEGVCPVWAPLGAETCVFELRDK